MLSEVSCDQAFSDLVNVYNTNYDKLNMEYHCIDGTKLSNGLDFKQAECTNFMKWSSPVEDCYGSYDSLSPRELLK